MFALNRKHAILFLLILIPGIVYSQSHTGKVICSESGTGIGYVNIGLIGKNTGTVSDKDGNFTISLVKASENDSIRFSIIGYESKTFSVGQFKGDSVKNILLKPASYSIPEIDVVYHKPKNLRIGNPVLTNDLRSGFSNNDLGSELGIKVNVRKKVLLKNINLDVAICTYDSVIYRLNIYQADIPDDYRNILKEPIYISFSKDDINKAITLDLQKYSIVVEGTVLITLELFKDLGEGRLLFRTEYFTGLTYHRKTSQGSWTQSPGVIGMSLNSIVLNQ
jgi:hypothetical protein